MIRDVLLIALVGIGFYARVTPAFFCGYDDFIEVQRAAFEDNREPARMFTTTHFDTAKYRPLERVFDNALWRMWGADALPFRVRNLFFHLLTAVLVYAIARFWTGERATASIAGVLFSIHPLANQPVVASTWIISCANAIALASLLLFLFALRSKRLWPIPVALALILVGLLTYETVIVAFGLMFVYLLVWRWEKRRLDRTAFTTLIVGCVLVLGVFWAIRHTFVHQANTITPPGIFVRNVAMYSGALLSPIDVVLSSVLFDTPLPPELHLDREMLVWIGGAGIVVILGLFLFLRTAFWRAARNRMNVPLVLFLAVSIPMSLVPFLVFTPHPSETYLYLPAALYSILLAIVMRALLPDSRWFAAAAAVFLVCFGAGTWIRNSRVASCGATAQRILQGLPLREWSQGDWRVRLSESRDEILPERFGIYVYEGISTIEVPSTGIRGAEAGIQFMTGNDRIHADVVPAEAAGNCPPGESCFTVYRDGRVEPAR